MAYVLIIAGILAFIMGITMLQKKETKPEPEVVEKLVYKDRIIEKEVHAKDIPQPKAKPKSIAPCQTAEKDKETSNFSANKAKGDAFEAFVVKNFNPKYFTLMEWRGDKYVDGVYAVSNHFPDLEVKFAMKSITDSFEVECKYRSNYFQNKVEWAKDFQLDNYKDYAHRLKIPVFIIIAIGGSPSKPEELYIIPLDELTTPEVTRSFLKPYKKDISKNFYWDEEKKELR